MVGFLDNSIRVITPVARIILLIVQGHFHLKQEPTLELVPAAMQYVILFPGHIILWHFS